MFYEKAWKAENMLYENQVDRNTNTPVDDYNYLKNLLDEKHNNRESISSHLYASYATAEMAAKDYLLEMNTDY